MLPSIWNSCWNIWTRVLISYMEITYVYRMFTVKNIRSLLKRGRLRMHKNDLHVATKQGFWGNIGCLSYILTGELVKAGYKCTKRMDIFRYEIIIGEM